MHSDISAPLKSAVVAAQLFACLSFFAKNHSTSHAHRGLFGCPTPLTLHKWSRIYLSEQCVWLAICTMMLARAGAIAWVDANRQDTPKLSFRDWLGGCMMRVANLHVNLTG
jgi:hypothetical protein